MAYLHLGEYKNALKCQYECLNIRRRIYQNNPKCKQIGQSLNDIGVAFIKNGQYDKAIGNLKEALEIRESIYKTPNEFTIETLNHLSNAYYKKGVVSYQEEYSFLALDKSEKFLKGDHSEFARALNNMANFYFFKVIFSGYNLFN